MNARILLVSLLALAASCGGDDDDASGWPQSVAYVQFRAPATAFSIVRVTADGQRRVVLWDAESPDWVPVSLQPSPSGETILVLLDGGIRGWYSLPSAGGALAPFSAPPDAAIPQWSPDGSAIAWILSETESHPPRVAVSAPGSAQATVLTPDSLYVQTFYAWSPDGTTLAFCAQLTGGGLTHIYLVPSAGGDVRRITQGEDGEECSPAWSPDGQHLAYIKNDDEIVIAGPDGSAPQHLAYASVSQPEGLFWSPDNSEVLTMASFGQRMVRIVVATGEEVPTGQYGYGYPTSPWSPNGTRLVSGGRTPPDSLGHTGPTVLVGNLDGSQTIQMSPDTLYAGHAAWLPPTE